MAPATGVSRPGWRGTVLLASGFLSMLLGGCELRGSGNAGQHLTKPPVIVAPAPAPKVVVEEPARTSEPKPARIALLAPMTGPRARLGRSLLNAVELALFETADTDLELRVYDTRGVPDGARTVALEAIADGVRIILGPVFGTSAEAVRPVASAAGVSVISFSNDRTIAGDGLYVLGVLPEQQVDRVVRLAAQNGRTSLGVLAPHGKFGRTVTEAAQRTAEQVGLSVTRVQGYDPQEADLEAVVREFAEYDRRKQALADERSLLASRTDPVSRSALHRLRSMETFGAPPFDAVLLPTGGRHLRTVAALLAYYDVDPSHVQFIGTSLWGGTEGLGTEPSLRGGWFAAVSPEHRSRFRQRFTALFEAEPQEIASQGYDAMLLAVTLVGADGDGTFSHDVLTDPVGFAGVDGLFRLLPDGSNQRGLAVMEVGDRTVTVLDPAPERFDQDRF